MPIRLLCVLAWCACALDSTAANIISPVPGELRCSNPQRSVDIKFFYRDGECPECEEARLFLFRLKTSFRSFNVNVPEWQKRLDDGPARGHVPAIQVCGEWFLGFDKRVTGPAILRLFTTTA
jgi:hypothetical protein